LALIDSYAGPWGFTQAQHLLKRTTFGAKYPEIKQVVANGLTYSVSQLLRLSPITNYPVNSYGRNGEDKDVPYQAQWHKAPYNGTFNTPRIHSVAHWWVERLVYQEMTLTEKMILFWHNHFGVAHTNSFDARMNLKYYVTLHGQSLGNFRELVKEMTIAPLMLNFLNGFESTNRAPDENYARELMELFTLGKGPESKYTEKDVQEAAKSFTGFVWDWGLGQADFFINRHNGDNKQFSSYFNNKVIKGTNTPGVGWDQEVFGVVDMIFEKEEVSKYICRKLHRFFIDSTITPTIEKEFIEPLAKILRDNNYHIVPVLETFFKSEHFFSSEYVGSMIKSPLDFLIGMFRELGPTIPIQANDRFDYLEYLRKVISISLQNIIDPPSVSGWPAYYQEPIYYKDWINSETLKLRSRWINIFSDKTYKERNTTNSIDFIEVLKTYDNPQDPNSLVEESLKRLISFPANADFKASLKKILLSDQDQDYYWTDAWNDFIANQNNAEKRAIVERRLILFMQNIMFNPEYLVH
jgi:uncharacterized protein (DUF1800 family)